MPRLTAVILFSLISLVSGLQAGQGLIIVSQEEDLRDEIGADIYAGPCDYAVLQGLGN